MWLVAFYFFFLFLILNSLLSLSQTFQMCATGWDNGQECPFYGFFGGAGWVEG